MIVEICSASFFASAFLFVYFAFFWKFSWINHSGKIAAQRCKNRHEIDQLPPVYPNGWFALLESSALKKDQVKLVFALGQNYAVFRKTTGKVRIVEACCSHLRAHVLTTKGKDKDVLECPLHSRLFCEQTEGYTDVPHSKNITSIVKTKSWDCTEVNGYNIFVWYHAESISPHWWPQTIDKISNGTWKYQGRSEFYIHSHIQDIQENIADGAHFDTVHTPFLIANYFISKYVRHYWSGVSWHQYSSQEENSDSINDSGYEDQVNKHIAICRFNEKVLFFEKFAAIEVNIKVLQIGPGYVEALMQTPLGLMCIIMSVTPVQPLLHRVINLVFAPMLLSPAVRIMMIGHSIMFERDLIIWNHKIHLKNPMFANSDKAIIRFRKWFKQFYSESSPTFESCKDNLLDI